MTKEEIIEMAEQAGFMFTDGSPIGFTYSMLKNFAKLVAEKEREECAKRLEAVGRQHCTEVYSFVHYLVEKAIRARVQE